jgi:hypothetical protein
VTIKSSRESGKIDGEKEWRSRVGERKQEDREEERVPIKSRRERAAK